jgi:hypothetical protein
LTLRCTEKVRKRLHLGPALLTATPAAIVAAADWHCHVLTLARRPTFMVTHSLSLFTVLFPAAGAASPAGLAAAVRHHVRDALARHGYPPGAAGRILDDEEAHFSRATDRSVLGSMNDFADMAFWAVHEHGSADPALLAATADEQMNRAPMSRLGMGRPREVLRLLLQSQGNA